VSNTSQPQDCITISSDIGIIAQEVSSVLPDTITLDPSTWNMTSGTGSSYYYNTGAGVGGSSVGTITISGGGLSGASIGSISTSSFNWKTEEFVDCLPDFDRVKSMCERYPGLKIAYEKFVTTYKLVKDDYDSTKD
jgi:hypothetical protein